MSNLVNFVKTGKKIVGAAINYKAVIKKKNLLKPDKPIFFLKPTSSYITEGQSIKVPEDFEITQEVELGVIIGKTCKKVPESEAMSYVGGYCLALDMTAMSELKNARQCGFPWALAKSFDTACPVSRFIKLEEIPDPHNIEIWSKVNGKLKQKANTNDFLFNIPQLISYYSKNITLEEGDLIVTGTPPGECKKLAREKGGPWCIGKGFDTSCPVSRFITLEEIKDPHNIELWCKVNGKLRQRGNTNDLIFDIPQLISYITKYMTLEPNDLLLTGTPPGNLPVDKGDLIEAGIGDIINLRFEVE
ncbi:acylpyruvase [Holotrichia oblita]|uniref:Acylpyruvase n=1 Tax=Holotrichia oblita TaxID=644536 RepID=A0ACB9SZV7_HOLOL|nr:acylpyruvase [Holotrichia oblita]